MGIQAPFLPQISRVETGIVQNFFFAKDVERSIYYVHITMVIGVVTDWFWWTRSYFKDERLIKDGAISNFWKGFILLHDIFSKKHYFIVRLVLCSCLIEMKSKV